jgi:phosphoglucosamine mutase
MCSKNWSKRGWLLGGEGSGHLLALDKHTTGDGLMSALQVLQALRAQWQHSWPNCWPMFTLFPQTLINVRLQPGQDWKSNAEMAAAQPALLKPNWATRASTDSRQWHRAAGAGDGGGA